MNKITALTFFYLLFFINVNAQVFTTDTLQYKGDPNKLINLVIAGDGYTLAQQSTFIADANNLINDLFGQSPWSNYVDYFNVFAIQVVSAQSGAIHPNTAPDCGTANPLVPVSNPTTYFGCSFDSYGIHRLVTPTNITNVSNVLASNFPNYDQVLIISNTIYYGGSGGNYSVSTANSASNEISAHELGHSFAGLADEYYAGDNYAAEKANMTQQTDPLLVKWKNWMGVNGIGIYQHCCGGNSALWYKPYTNCKMQLLGVPYCAVCKQTFIEKIHSLVNPIIYYLPNTLSVTSPSSTLTFQLENVKPIPNTLQIDWKLDGNTVFTNIDSIQLNQAVLTSGSHNLVATVVDTNTLVNVDNHSTIHFNTVTWTINKTSTAIHVLSKDNTINYSIFPNPASEVLNISLDVEKRVLFLFPLLLLKGK